MNTGIWLIVAFIFFMGTVMVGFIGGLFYFNSEPVVNSVSTSLSSSSSSTSTSSTSTTSTTYKPVTISTTSTSSTVTTSTVYTRLKDFEIELFEDTYYKNDDVVIKLHPSDNKIVKLFLNGKFKDSFRGNDHTLLSMKPGYYNVMIERAGYRNQSVDLEVEDRTYATHQSRRQALSISQRLKALNEGKVLIRFYDSSSCSICKAILPRVNNFVDDNKECIVYEKLFFRRYPEEVIPGLLPTIVVQGKNGLFKQNGVVPMNKIRSMFERAGGTECKNAL